MTALCLLLFACSPQPSWERYPALSHFGAFSGTDPEGRPFASTIAGVFKVASPEGPWQRLALPGASARYLVARDGRELASTYGIYLREPPSEGWSLIPGSRALNLAAVAQDTAKNVYAQTDDATFAVTRERETWVLPVGGTDWQKLELDPKGQTALLTDFPGNVYAVTQAAGGAQQLVRVEGTRLTPLPHPTAQTFDFRGRRFLVSPARTERVDDGMGGVRVERLAFQVQRVTEAQELEDWTRFEVDAPGPALADVFGFGQDDRLYAAVLDDAALLPPGVDYAAGDLVSVGKGERAFRRAVSLAEPGGPTLLRNYAGSFVADGSIIFAGCESGCSGSGNAFSYGVWRLHLGGTP